MESSGTSGICVHFCESTVFEADSGVIAELRDNKRRSLKEQVLDLLTQGMAITQAKHHDPLAAQNERLGAALESLERAGRLCRTPAGWQRLD
jgi:hypothetical protein